MRLLLDTHILVWLAQAPDALVPNERRLLEDANGPLIVSAISLWEIRIKWEKLHPSGERKGTISPAQAMAHIERAAFDLVPISVADCAAMLDPPCESGDPFDQMLLIQAGNFGARLLTRDRRLADHPLAICG